MLPPDEFTKAMQNLGVAFGKPLNGPLILQYYNVLGGLSGDQLAALIKWAIESLDAPFPTIARLRKHAVDEGWFANPGPQTRTNTALVEVVCPKCDGSFMVAKDTLLADARNGRIYRCFNHRHWGCSMTFSAATLVQEMRLA